jgi:putative NADH-flavin reductase
MQIALIGVIGRVGSRVAAELLSRGHAVTGIALHASRDARPGVKALEADATKPESLAPCIVGHDAVISATRFVTSDADP